MTRTLVDWIPAIALATLACWIPSVAGQVPPGQPPLTAGQQRRLGELAELEKRINVLLGEDKLPQAIALRRAELEIDRRIFGPDHPRVAQSAGGLALLLEWNEDFRGARLARVEERDILARALGEKHWRVADARGRVEYIDLLARMSPAGRRRLDRAGAMAGTVLELIEAGKPGPALPHAVRHLEELKALLPPDHLLTATALHNLVRVRLELGDYRDAVADAVEARRMLRVAVGPAHPTFASALNLLGSLYLNCGNPAAALPLLEEAAELTRTLEGETSQAHTACLTNLADARRGLGDPAGALDLLRREHDLIVRSGVGEAAPAYHTSLNNLAVTCHELRLYEEAAAHFERAERLMRRHGRQHEPHYANTLSSQANLLAALGQDENRIKVLRRVLELRTKDPGPGHPLYADALHNLGAAHHDAGRFDEARAWYEQGRRRRLELLGDRHPAYAESLDSLAGLFRDHGHYDRAEELFRRALDLKSSLPAEHPSRAGTLGNLGMVLHDRGRPLAAATALRAALRAEETNLHRTLGYLGGQQRRDVLARARAALHEYLSAALTAGVPAEDLYDRALAWKGAAADWQAEERVGRDQPGLRGPFADLRLLAAEVALLAAEEPPEDERGAWRERLARKQAEKQRLEDRIAQGSAALARQVGRRAAGGREVVERLPAGAALIDFLFYTHTPPGGPTGPGAQEYRLLAFVAAPGRPLACVQLGAADPIEKAVAGWREAVLRTGRPDGTAEDLARRLWAPLRAQLGDHTRAVLIAPQESLVLLPFGALPGSAPGRYLIEDVAIGYLTSGRALLDLAPRADVKGRGLLAVGGLSYGPAGRHDYRPLPGTGGECRRAAEVYGEFVGEDARALVGESVDAARLRDELSRAPAWRHVHLATHGFVRAVGPAAPDRGRRGAPPAGAHRNPLLDVGVVLTGGNQDPRRGLLTGEEIATLDLRGTELVVLSTCGSALGPAGFGEGLLGLRRAFELAEARATVSTLWDVEDGEAAGLIERFYRNHWEGGLPRLEALRRAQCQVLRGGAGDSAAPRNWAGWVLSGDPGDLAAVGPFDPPPPASPPPASPAAWAPHAEGWTVLLTLLGGGALVAALVAAALARRARRDR